MTGKSLKDQLNKNNKTIAEKAIAKMTRAVTPVAAAPIVVNPALVHKALFDVMAELTELLETEQRYLKARNVEGIKGLLPRKYQLISVYQANIKTIAQQAMNPSAMSGEVRLKLRAAGEKLSVVTERNASALSGAVRGTRRIVDNVMGMIKEEAKQDNATYKNFRAGAASKYKEICAPVAVSRSV
jgi:hypothetical protein